MFRVTFSLLILLSSLHSTTAIAQRQWLPGNNSGSLNPLSSVMMLDNTAGWAVGPKGTVIRTTDGGESWVQVPGPGENFWLRTAYFTSETDGVLLGENTTPSRFAAFYTTDGGITWGHAAVAGTGTAYKIMPHGDLLVGYGGADAFLALPDGKSWTRIPLPNGEGYQFPPLLTDMDISPEGYLYFLSSDTRLYRSNTPYGNWRMTLLEGWSGVGDAYKAVAAPGRGIVLALDKRGRVARSVDSGMTWDFVDHPQTNQAYELPLGGDGTFNFTSETDGVLTGKNGTVIRTSDAGATWELIVNDQGVDLVGATFPSRDTGFVAEGKRIYRTIDGGTTWTTSSLPGAIDSRGVAHRNGRTFVGVGAGGQGGISIDGGLNWQSLETGTTLPLADVAFADEEIGIAVGESGTIVRTSDGGMTWSTSVSSTTAPLTSVVMVDRATIYAVGGGSTGVILRSTDAGATWSAVVTDAPGGLSDITFVTPSVGFAVGRTNLIMRTADGGVSWKEISLAGPAADGTSRVFTSVSFIDAETGVIGASGIGGDNGAILRTTDGGDTWSPVYEAENTSGYREVTMHTADYITALGLTTTLVSRDGGMSWDVEKEFPGLLYSMAFSRDGEGVIVGNDGLVFRSEDDYSDVDDGEYFRLPSDLDLSLHASLVPDRPLEHQGYSVSAGKQSQGLRYAGGCRSRYLLYRLSGDCILLYYYPIEG